MFIRTDDYCARLLFFFFTPDEKNHNSNDDNTLLLPNEYLYVSDPLVRSPRVRVTYRARARKYTVNTFRIVFRREISKFPIWPPDQTGFFSYGTFQTFEMRMLVLKTLDPRRT